MKPEHYQNGADSCVCGEVWPCTKLRAIRWRRSRDGFCESYDGHWRIVPLFCGSTKPQGFELQRDGKVVSRMNETQREAKEHAEYLVAKEWSLL